MTSAWMLVFHLLLTPGPAQAEIVPVFVDHSGKDRVGTLLADELREAIRRSEAFTMAPTLDEGPVVRLDLITMEGRCSCEGQASVAAIAVVIHPAETLLGLQVVSVGRDRTPAVAREIIAELDARILRIRQLLGRR